MESGTEAQKEAELGHVAEKKELQDVVQTLPSDAVNHLVSLGFTFSNDSGIVRKKDDLVVLIADMVKQERYQFDTFSLEVSMPPIILDNDNYLRTTIIFLILSPFHYFPAPVYTKIVCESNLAGEKPLSSSIENESSDCCKFLLETANEPCHFTYFCYRTPLYFGGRYLKYSRNVSQTRWIIDDERMGEASVEEIIGGNILQACQADSFKFHAAGREDIDVRMLGPGRPFLVELQNTRHVPSELFVKDIEKMINSMENKLVRVKNLKLVGSDGWDLMREGEAEKQKQYAALVWISRPLKDEDFQCLSSLNDLKVLQRTPIRVLHRRSPLEREKIIHWMKIETIAGSSQYFLLHLCTQAGTYIKEFVHGDLGRTHPSIGSILGCRAEILQLDVTDIKMECFLT
ncbi:Pseudouridine synthase, catalytic domain superfamily [Sesbania bispinosa]|nr:Pseudouridine synthase, catalytic domain superfamily [Sesbania bispinosa]